MVLVTLLMAKMSTRCDSWRLGVLRLEENMCVGVPVCLVGCFLFFFFLIIFLPVAFNYSIPLLMYKGTFLL